MTYSIKQLFHIAAPREEVYAAITSIKGLNNWWTVQTEGDTSLNGLVKFNFGEFAGPTMKVVELTPNERLVWQCVDEGNSWYGHVFTFLLDENEGKTRLRFMHDGWEENEDFYAHCSFSWGRYLESLRQYCQTGKGEAYGSSAYKQ